VGFPSHHGHPPQGESYRKVERMFGGSGDGSATRRVPDAPIPVLVAMDELWPRETITIRGVSLGVRAYGLRVDGLWPGLLIAWERSSQGTWLAVCVLQLRSPNDLVHRDLLQLVPARAIRRRNDDASTGMVVGPAAQPKDVQT